MFCDTIFAMMDMVDAILKGKFDYGKGSLDLTPSKIELSLCPGEEYTGSFFVSGMDDRLTEGTVCSHDPRLTVINDSFIGAKEEIGFSFSARGLEEGDVVRSEIAVISNQGEYFVPVTVTVLNKSVDTSLGNIRNLFHFTNLAKANWEEAVKLFYSDSFINILTGQDRQYVKTYLGLSRDYGNEQNVEEFLLTINKKHAVEYICDRTSVTLHEPEPDTVEHIGITRNGWGYTELFVSTDSDFITLSGETISSEDFVGNFYDFTFGIDSSKLHDGNNFGQIIFTNSYVSFSVDVVATGHEINKQDFSKYIELWHLRLDLMTYFEAFRSKKVSLDRWIAESDRIVERMLMINERMSIARLYKAQILIAGERYQEAKWILDQVEADYVEQNRADSVSFAYCMYLNTLIDRDDDFVNEITEKVKAIYEKNPSSADLTWMIIYLSNEYMESPAKRWLFLEDQIIKYHCTSPIIYLEALNVLITDPAMLTKLSDSELIVMRYGAKNGLITPDLARQFVYIAGKDKTYSKSAYEILKVCFEMNPTDETVSAVCTMLIEAGLYGEEYYRWFLEAIKRELRITKLYEFYMDSLNLSKEYEIPKMVYLYFSYECNLDWEKAAYLFARVIEHREEMPEIHESYRFKIEKFVTTEMLKGRINRDLALVYRFILPDYVLEKEMCEALSRLLFMRRIKADPKRFVSVVVFHNKENLESIYPMDNGVAYVPVYERDYTIMLEDMLSNRYIKSVDYDLEKLIVPGKLSSMITGSVTDNLEYDVYICTGNTPGTEDSDGNRERYKRILESDIIDDEYKNEIRDNLLKYFFYNDRIRELDEVLNSAEPDPKSRKARTEIIRYLILRGFYDKAYEWVRNYGFEGNDQKDILRLVSKLISRSEETVSYDLVSMAATLFFKGRSDDVTYGYLAAYYRGLTKDLRRIFNAASEHNADVRVLCERMLTQMLYTAYYVPERLEVYKRYVSLGADPGLRRAFLYQCSYDYFVKEQITDGYIFEELIKLERTEGGLDKVCKLAILKYYSERNGRFEESEDILRRFLRELLNEGVYMSFFREFVSIEPSVLRYSDKTVIEYKTEPGKPVYIHYIVESGSDAGSEYITEEMPDLYGGVHVKAFVLFFGENLLYYVTEGSGAEEMLTESGNISKSDTAEGIDTRFNEINDISIAGTLGDYDTVENLLYEYYKHDYVVRKTFKLQ